MRERRKREDRKYKFGKEKKRRDGKVFGRIK